jgi:ABC-type phosphate transport system ATPase subunit
MGPYATVMGTVKEIQEALPKLSRHEVEELRDWIDDYLESQMELSDETKAKLDQSRADFSSGQYSTRQPRN